MEFRVLIGLLLVGSGIFISVFSLANIIQKIDMVNSVLLILGCILMVSGALLKYRAELDIAERKIDEERKKLGEEEEEISKLKKGNDGISRWKLRDLEYKVKKLESEMVKTKDSE